MDDKRALLHEMRAACSGTGDCEDLERLLRRGVSPNLRLSRDGGTPLHAVVIGRASPADEIDERLALLLRAGADVDARMDSQFGRGWTPLMLACAEGNVAQVRTLIDGGADVSAVDARGSSPLLILASGEWRAVDKMDLLLRAGADVGHRSQEGKTPEKVLEEARDELIHSLRLAIVASRGVSGGL